MKFSTFLIIALLVMIAALLYKRAPQPSAEVTYSGDPVAAMIELVREFPMEFTYKGEPASYHSVAYDVRKTDSVVNPVIGYVNFDKGQLQFQYVFHWIEDRWRFHKMYNRQDHIDFTYTPGGIELMESGGMPAFLEKYGRPRLTKAEPKLEPPPEPAPEPGATPLPVSTPPPKPTSKATPSPADVQAEILRKYGTKP